MNIAVLVKTNWNSSRTPPDGPPDTNSPHPVSLTHKLPCMARPNADQALARPWNNITVQEYHIRLTKQFLQKKSYLHGRIRGFVKLHAAEPARPGVFGHCCRLSSARAVAESSLTRPLAKTAGACAASISTSPGLVQNNCVSGSTVCRPI